MEDDKAGEHEKQIDARLRPIGKGEQWHRWIELVRAVAGMMDQHRHGRHRAHRLQRLEARRFGIDGGRTGVLDTHAPTVESLWLMGKGATAVAVARVVQSAHRWCTAPQ